MLEITVKYFLNEEGAHYFYQWYDEVYKISSQQDGFKSMGFNMLASNISVVTLHFENQAKLTAWARADIHNELVAKLEPFLSKPRKVSVVTSNLTSETK